MLSNYNFSDSSLSVMILIFGFAIALGIGFYLFIRFFKQETKFKLSAVEVDVLKAADVISWFKIEDNLKQLKENPELQPVVLKGDAVKTLKSFKNISEDKNRCVAALFDKTKNHVAIAQVFIYKVMEEDLIKMFGNKDMIIMS